MNIQIVNSEEELQTFKIYYENMGWKVKPLEEEEVYTSYLAVKEKNSSSPATALCILQTEEPEKDPSYKENLLTDHQEFVDKFYQFRDKPNFIPANNPIKLEIGFAFEDGEEVVSYSIKYGKAMREFLKTNPHPELLEFVFSTSNSDRSIRLK